MAQNRRRLALWLFLAGLAMVVAGKLLLGGSGSSGLGTIPLPASAENRPGPISEVACHPDLHARAAYHAHAKLTISMDGQAVPVPAGIGIVTDPKTGEEVCMYELHTHDDSGTIHVEAPEKRVYTLGQFFDVAGAPLTPANIGGLRLEEGAKLRVTVDGKPLEKLTAETLRGIELSDGREIVIEIRSPGK